MDGISTDVAALLAESAWVRGLARGLLADAGAADDVAQETMLAALRRADLEEAAPGSKPGRPWLARVARNFVWQRMRGELAREGRERASARPEALPSAAELVARMERQQMLAEAVTRLPEPYRSTVILRYVEGLEPIEIARRGGVPPGTVRRRLKEGLDRLREDLDRRFGGDRGAWMSALLPFAREVLSGGVIVMKAWVTAAVVVIGAASLVFFLSDGVGGGDGPESARGEPATELAEAEGAQSELASPAPVQDRTSGVQIAERVAESAAAITGRVLFPRGHAEDPTLEVILFREARTYGQAVRALDAREDEAEILARAPVDSAGSFRALVPRGTAIAHALVRGRHLYLARTTAASPGMELELAPEAGAWIVGRLFASPATETAGATVEIYPRSGLDPAGDVEGTMFATEIQSDSEGEFEVRAAPVRFGYGLIALPSRLAAARLEVDGLKPLERRSVEATLGSGGTVRGTVVAADGAFVADAEVEAAIAGRLLGFDDRTVRTARTDERGRFELAGVAAGEVALRARKPGLLESARTRVDLGEGLAAVGVVLRLESGGEIRGRLARADGAPAAGVAVRASFDRAWRSGAFHLRELRGASGEALTDANGRFAIAGLGEGPFTLAARVEDPKGELHARRDGILPGAEDVALALHPLQALRGRVQDAAGAPLDRFRLRCARSVDGPLGPALVERREIEVAAHDGAFAVGGLVAGRFAVEVTGDAATSSAPVEVTLPAPAGADELVLRVERAASLAGTVLDPAGLPRANASLRLGPSAERRGPVRATSDAAGRFWIAGLGSGPIELRAEAAGFAPSEPLIVDLRAGEAFEGAVLSLRLGGTLTGEVHDRPGRPASGRFVHAETEDESRVAHADSQGRFRFEHLVPGTWTVIAVDPSFASGGTPSVQQQIEDVDIAQVSIDDGGSAHVVLGARSARAVVVHGTIVQAAQGAQGVQGGKPYGDAWVSFVPSEGAQLSAIGYAHVGGDGSYEVELATPGPYTVGVALFPSREGDESTVDFMRTIPAVARYRLDLELPSGRISGRVTTHDGSPAARARVTLFADGRELPGEYSQGQYADLAAGEDGRFEIPSLRTGRYRVAAGGSAAGARWSGGGGDVQSYARAVAPAIDLAPGEARRDVEIRLPQAGSARVDVVDESGAPVAGATVFARGADGEIVDPLSAAMTDARGRAAIDGLAAGTAYSFQSLAGSRASPESAPVRAGADADPVRLVLGRGTRLRVKLVDGSGHAVQGWASVLDAEGRDAGSLYPAAELLDLLARGAFSPTAPIFGPLPPGAYTVEAQGFGGQPVRREVATAGESDLELVVRVID